VATVTSLVNRVRFELGDMGKAFVAQFMADGTTNRFELGYNPIDASSVTVTSGLTDISNSCYVEESTGILTLPTIPDDGTMITVNGTYYRYFTYAELTSLVTDAVAQHAAGHTDSLGRQLTLATLPVAEEYPVSLYATTLALYALATDAAFDIDIAAPDGVTIPRSQRYQHLMEMIQTRQAQYRDLCVQLGIGLYKIDVFQLRRISQATGRYVPVYKPQEVDDRSYPERVHTPLPTYGDKPVPWPTFSGDLEAYQGRAFSTTVNFTPNPDWDENVTFIAKLLNQRGSVLVVEYPTLEVTTNTDGTYAATISLTSDQTLRIAQRTYWSVQIVDPNSTDVNSGSIVPVEVAGGNFYTVRLSEVVL
jgi:hypothetical protein